MLTVAQLAPLKDRDPYLYETLTKIVSAVNSASQAAGVDQLHAIARADSGRIDQRAGLERLVRCRHHRPKRRAPRPVLFRRVRHHSLVQRAARLFSRRQPQSLRPARQSDALLARLQPIHRLDRVAPRTFGSPPTAVVGGGASGPTPQPSKGSGALPTACPAAATASASTPAPASQNLRRCDQPYVLRSQSANAESEVIARTPLRCKSANTKSPISRSSKQFTHRKVSTTHFPISAIRSSSPNLF